MAANLEFKHPKVEKGPLKVWVNPNQIEWAYALNTANYNTYGGEVIQILSTYIDDMTVNGNVSTYRQMEEIYAWFIEYIQIATTGVETGRFNVHPVEMYYAEREWHFHIYPKAMPGFRYGRDVVAPEWQLQAAVVDPDQSHPLKEDILTTATKELILQEEGQAKGTSIFGKATGNIGFEEEDPFSGPLSAKEEKKKEKQLLHGEAVRGSFKELADSYNKLLPAYLEGDFTDLTADYSKPVIKGVNGGTAEAKATVDSKKKHNHA